MSAFTFDFDLEDDLDESLDSIIIPPQEPNVPPILASAELPAVEVPLSELVRIHPHIVPVQSIPHHPTRRQRSSPRSQKPSHTRRSSCPPEIASR